MSKITIPQGWYVSECGQNPLHMLWYMVLLNFDDVVNNVESPRFIFTEEKDSFEKALDNCREQIEKLEKLNQ